MGVRTGIAWLLGGKVEGWLKSEWEESGVSSHSELDEWIALNVRQPALVGQWRAAGLKSPPEARFWIALRQEPQDAVAWMRVCAPEEARDWIVVGLRPADAQAWKVYGVAPREFAQWKRFGVETSAEIVGWSEAGFKPDAARPWLRAGVADPIEAKQWSDAGATPKVRSAWLKAGFSSAEALTLVVSGVGRKDASALRAVGALVAEIPGWVASGEGPRGARRWIEVGMPPQDFTAWSPSGGWKAFRRWAGDPSSFAELRGHTAGWAAAGMSPEDAVMWLAVTGDPHVAAEWQERGFSSSAAREWCEAGFRVPGEAAFWLDERRPPDWVRAWEAAVGTDSAGWYGLTNGDVDAVKAWRAAGAASVREATAFATALEHRDSGIEPLQAYQQLRVADVGSLPAAHEWVAAFPLSSALDWLRVGLDAPADAAAWVNAGFSAAEAGGWRAVHADPTVCAAWRAAAGDLGGALRWQRAGVDSPADAATLRSAIVDPSEAEEWIRLEAISAESILRWRTRWGTSTAAEWTDRLGVDLESAWDWCRVVDGDLNAATELLRVGYSPATTRDWLQHGFDPSEMIGWRSAGCDSADHASRLAASGVAVGEAVAWTDLGADLDSVLDWRTMMALDEAARWASAVGSLESALLWKSFTSRDVAAEFVIGGISEPGDGQRWLEAGFAVGDAIRWSRAGLEPSAAGQWVRAGLSHGQARAWACITTDPGTAKEWMAACPDGPKAAAAWDQTGVTPSRSVELRAIGLTADTHAALHMASRTAGDYDSRLRAQAARHSGLDVTDDGTLLVDVTGTATDAIPYRLGSVLAAAATAGERTVRVRHGAPRLSPESVSQLPEARYIRGASKVAVLHYGWGLGESRFQVTDDGSHSEFSVEVSESPSEFIRVDAEVGQ